MPPLQYLYRQKSSTRGNSGIPWGQQDGQERATCLSSPHPGHEDGEVAALGGREEAGLVADGHRGEPWVSKGMPLSC